MAKARSCVETRTEIDSVHSKYNLKVTLPGKVKAILPSGFF